MITVVSGRPDASLSVRANGIEEKILKPLSNRPGAELDTLKKLRILIRHAKEDLKWIAVDPSEGIKRGRSKEIRLWTDPEMAAYEKRWDIGTRQRAAYELILSVGTARTDTHLTTWVQADAPDFEYTRQKTGVSIAIEKATSPKAVLDGLKRVHSASLRPSTGSLSPSMDSVAGMCDAIKAAGITDLKCQPHGLRKTFGRLLADAGIVVAAGEQKSPNLFESLGKSEIMLPNHRPMKRTGAP